MFALVVCALYYLMGKCGCRRVEGLEEPCPSTLTTWRDCYDLSKEECTNHYYIHNSKYTPEYNGAYKCENTDGPRPAIIIPEQTIPESISITGKKRSCDTIPRT